MDSFWHKAAAESGGQARCDSIQAEYRTEPEERRSIRRDPPPTPKAAIPTGNLLRLRLAEELDYARRMLDVMGDELAADGLIVSRHMTALQSVDVVGQLLGHIASIVRSSDPEGAVERIGMCELKGRLQRQRIG